jgi:predicted ATPase with chaperone activity
MAQRSADIRNLVLFGHGGTGKTTLIDALAVFTKVANRRGDSVDGTSISNTEPEEKERKQTLTSHVFSFPMGEGTLDDLGNAGGGDRRPVCECYQRSDLPRAASVDGGSQGFPGTRDRAHPSG